MNLSGGNAGVFLRKAFSGRHGGKVVAARTKAPPLPPCCWGKNPPLSPFLQMASLKMAAALEPRGAVLDGHRGRGSHWEWLLRRRRGFYECASNSPSVLHPVPPPLGRAGLVGCTGLLRRAGLSLVLVFDLGTLGFGGLRFFQITAGVALSAVRWWSSGAAWASSSIPRKESSFAPQLR